MFTKKNYQIFLCWMLSLSCIGTLTAKPGPLQPRRFIHQPIPLQQKAPCQADAQVILQGKICVQDKRYTTFLAALELMRSRNAQTIVETGTARGGLTLCEGDGCSTLIWNEWAASHHAHVYSVDIDAEALEAAQTCLGREGNVTTLIHQDSVSFLESFGKPIDFLYLDSYDFDVSHPHPSQQHHLKEILAAYPWLHKKSVVMIDDCDLPEGGKGKLAIAFLQSLGWIVLQEGYQVILVMQEV